MDTIIYFYKKRDLQRPETEALQRDGYLLVRVGMDVGEDRWFSHSLKPLEDSAAAFDVGPGQGLTLRQRLKIGRRRREVARQQRKERKLLRRETDLVRRQMQSFLAELSGLADDRYECSCVYADAVRKVLFSPQNGTSGLSSLWQECCRIPEFDGYFQPEWAGLLLPHVSLHRFVVLGIADCVPMVFSHCARRMKSLQWFVREEDCTEELQDFLEDFYEEWGLAAALQPLEGKRAYARLLLETSQPVCILDFTGEPSVSPDGVAAGSIWIDFCSVEEKARRISERGKGIACFSLKEMWKSEGKS